MINFIKTLSIISAFIFCFASCDKGEIIPLENSEILARNASSKLLVKERSALKDLYYANPDNTLGWDLSANVNTWQGVVLNAAGRVSVLRITHKEIKVIPASISDLQSLHQFYLGGNHLSELPYSFKYMQNLRYLYMGFNDFTEIPNVLNYLKDLDVLVLSHNYISEISEPICTSLHRLSILNLFGNKISEVPPYIYYMYNLRNLNLGRNNITRLPNEIYGLKSLRELRIHNNDLVSVPELLGSLRNLQHLQINNNRLTFLPNQISRLRNLQTLDIRNNNITSIPNSVCNMTVDFGTQLLTDAGVCQ